VQAINYSWLYIPVLQATFEADHNPSNSQVDVDSFRVPQWGMGECLLQTVRDIVCSCNIYKSITPKLLLLIIIDSSFNSCQHNPHRKLYTKLEPSIWNTMCPLSANFLFFYWLSRSLVSLLPFRWASFWNKCHSPHPKDLTPHMSLLYSKFSKIPPEWKFLTKILIHCC
jgi:hypothetical protein